MVYFNGDKICVKRSHSKDRFLEFGRVQEYVEEEAYTTPSQSTQFANYGDVLSSDDTLFSSTAPTSSLDSDGGNEKSQKKRVPLLHVLSPGPSRKSTLGSILGLEDNGGAIPGLTSPIMMKRSKSQSDMIEGEKGKGIGGKERIVKKRIIWDNCNKVETEIVGGKNEKVYRVVDRKFQVGQYVTRSSGKRTRGKIVEVTQLATVHVPFSDPENKNDAHVIRDLNLSEIKPISPIFHGVTIEFNGWIGSVTDVERQSIYKLEDSTYLTRLTQDSTLIRNSRNTPITSTSSKSAKEEESEQRSIQTHFSYPFMPNNTEVPFIGKLERFSKLRLDQLKIEEEENKENNENCRRYATRSKTGATSSSSSTLPSLNMEVRKRNKLDRENFITACIVDVSIVSIKVRWTGRLPAYLIKVKTEQDEEKVKRNAVSCYVIQRPEYQDMPASFIRSTQDIKKVRPLYINPAMYFEKKGLCSYTTTKKNEDIMIPVRLWSYELYNEALDNNGSLPVPVAPFNLSAIKLSPPKNDDKEGKDSTKNSDDYDRSKVKRKRENEDGKTEESRRTVIVSKHFVRHLYKVIWDEDQKTKRPNTETSPPSWYPGPDLAPLSKNPFNGCLGFTHSHSFILPRTGSCMYGHCDYGVVVEKLADDSIVVEWLSIQDGSVSSVRTLKCEMFDVDKHPKFNEFHEGRMVVRRSDAVYKSTREFCFGTIVHVHRLGLGQISVYCPIQEKIIELWPHMIDLFVGMPMQELIAHKVVGVNKKTEKD